MGYNVIKYWNSRKHPNNGPTTHNKKLVNKQINYISSFLRKDMNVLDIGPGIGRLAEAYKGVTLSIFDVSTIYKNRLIREYKKNNINIKNIIIEKNKWIKLPFKDDEFDVVTTSLVLLHQPPNTIVNFISELVRVGKKVVCISTTSKGMSNKSNHVFDHNYKKIVEDIDFIYEEIEITNIGQIYFIIKKDEV